MSDEMSETQQFKIIADTFCIFYPYLCRTTYVKSKLKEVSFSCLG